MRSLLDLAARFGRRRKNPCPLCGEELRPTRLENFREAKGETYAVRGAGEGFECTGRRGCGAWFVNVPGRGWTLAGNVRESFAGTSGGVA